MEPQKNNESTETIIAIIIIGVMIIAASFMNQPEDYYNTWGIENPGLINRVLKPQVVIENKKYNPWPEIFLTYTDDNGEERHALLWGRAYVKLQGLGSLGLVEGYGGIYIDGLREILVVWKAGKNRVFYLDQDGSKTMLLRMHPDSDPIRFSAVNT